MNISFCRITSDLMDDVFRVSVVGRWMQVCPFGRGAPSHEDAASTLTKTFYSYGMIQNPVQRYNKKTKPPNFGAPSDNKCCFYCKT